MSVAEEACKQERQGRRGTSPTSKSSYIAGSNMIAEQRVRELLKADINSSRLKVTTGELIRNGPRKDWFLARTTDAPCLPVDVVRAPSAAKMRAAMTII